MKSLFVNESLKMKRIQIQSRLRKMGLSLDTFHGNMQVFTYIKMSACCIGSKLPGPPQNKRNNGVEVPCCYRIKGLKRCIDNVGIIKEILAHIAVSQCKYLIDFIL